MKKKTILLAFLPMLFFSGAALQYQVDIPAIRNASVLGVQAENTTSGVHEINMTVENIGSAACEYRLKGDYRYENISKNQFSKEYGLWPGSSETAYIYFTPLNYTGQVNVSMSISYCGKTEELDTFNFTMEQKVQPEKSLNYTVSEVNKSATRIRLQELETGLLVPADSPPYWKVSPAEVEDGKATLEYDPTIFREGENITYIASKNSSVRGKIRVTLEEESGILKKTVNFLTEIVS